MNAKLIKTGDTYALQLEAELVEVLGLREGDESEVTSQDRSILIRSGDHPDAQRRFNEALAETNARYGGVLRRLAE